MTSSLEEVCLLSNMIDRCNSFYFLIGTNKYMSKGKTLPIILQNDQTSLHFVQDYNNTAVLYDIRILYLKEVKSETR